MSKSEETQDQLERMLDKWGQQLPEAPAQLVTSTLNEIQVSKSYKRRNWFAVPILGGMVAASLVVVAGLVILAGADKTAIPVATQVAAVVVATPTTGNAEVANPVSTSEVTTAATPTAPPTPTQVVTTNASTPDKTPPTIALDGPTPAVLGADETPVQPTVILVPAQTAPATAIPAVAPTATPAAKPPTVAPVSPTDPATPPTAKPTNRVPIASTAPPDEERPLPSATSAPQPVAPGGPVVLSGAILSFDGGKIRLSSSTELIAYNSATKVIYNGAPTPFSTLILGTNVTIQATRDKQGGLVADTITVAPKLPKRG